MLPGNRLLLPIVDLHTVLTRAHIIYSFSWRFDLYGGPNINTCQEHDLRGLDTGIFPLLLQEYWNSGFFVKVYDTWFSSW